MIFFSILILVSSYLSIGYLFHFVIFPETKPDFKTYFETGDVIKSDRGGTQHEVQKLQRDKIHLTSTFAPHAEGPPVHIQTGWDEKYKVLSGILTLRMDGENRKLQSGEEVLIPRGVPHKPSNPSDEPVVCEIIMPAQFAVYLSQLYGYMDDDERNAKPPRMILQMALTNQYFDSYLGEGPPIWVQKVLNFLILPAARLMGYQSFYEKYRI